MIGKVLFLILVVSSQASIQSFLKCQQCHAMVKGVQEAESIQESGIVWFLELVAEAYCAYKKIEDFDVCKGAVEEMTPVIFDGIKTRFLDQDYICPLLSYCPQVYVPLKEEDYVQKILIDKPANTQWPAIDGTETVDIIHISDIHTDMFYEVGANAECTKPLCCRAESGQPEEGKKIAGYWGTLASCDLPERTVDQMIQFLKEEVINKDRKTYLFWTGDSVSHDIWEQGQDYNIQNSRRLTEKFTQAGLNVEFIPQVGNHEAFPVNEYDYSAKTDGGFRQNFSDMWAHWLGEEQAQFFKQNGFYKREFDNFKVIAFDSQICNPDNWFLLKDPTDPTNFLVWAEEELKQSEKLGQAVYFTAHIYTSSCLVPWAKRFNALIERYAYIVRGQIYGHAHGEFFNLYKGQDRKAMNVAFISSSMTTYSYRNPSFRKFEVDAKTMIPKNYFEYRLNLNKYNKEGPNATLKWDIAFNFLEEYGVKSMYPQELQQLTERIFDEPELLKKFTYNMHSGTSSTGVTAQSMFCKLSYSISEEQQLCNNQPIQKDWTEYVTPGWHTKIQ